MLFTGVTSECIGLSAAIGVQNIEEINDILRTVGRYPVAISNPNINAASPANLSFNFYHFCTNRNKRITNCVSYIRDAIDFLSCVLSADNDR